MPMIPNEPTNALAIQARENRYHHYRGFLVVTLFENAPLRAPAFEC